MPPRFVPGMELSAGFYRDAVAPLLRGQPHAAALLGWGSDVLGYDSERSTDHGWGPRALVFLPETTDSATLASVADLLEAELPASYRGWPVRFGWDEVAVRHWVTVTTLPRWLRDHLGFDATQPVTTLDWLVTPQQRLLGVVAGAVFADPTGELRTLRQRLRWYPDQVWRWLLACQWRRLAQQEAFVSRTAEAGDQLGSVLLAGRQVLELMRLALLLERRYAPYPKWLGTAFARLPHADDLPAQLNRVLRAPEDGREDALAEAYATVAARHNRTGVTEPLPTDTGPYHSRPAQVLMADRFTDACLATVTDPALRALPLIGAIDQHVDSTDLLTSPELFRSAAAVYAHEDTGSS